MEVKWTEEEDRIVEEYERAVREGKVKEIVIIPRDEEARKIMMERRAKKIIKENQLVFDRLADL